MSKRIKIEVYLSEKNKKEIKKNANEIGISLSDYMKLKALDKLK